MSSRPARLVRGGHVDGVYAPPVIREGTLDDIPSAAAMRQRAWPDMILTAEGMRHSLENVPDRAELLMLAWDEGGEIVGWGTAGREWWVSEPHRGTLVVAVDPGRRGEGIGSALAAAATRTSRRSA